MNLDKYIKNNCLSLKVIPQAKTVRLIEENNSLKLYLQSPPEKNKANLELIKYFKKEFHLKVKINSGEKSKEKIILLQNS